MPDRTLRRAVLGLALGLGVVALTAPPAPAQDAAEPQRWAASEFDAPFDEPGHEVRADPFDVSGTMRYEKATPADQIVQVQVRLVDDPADDIVLAAECLPAPVVAAPTQPQQDPGTAVFPFAVEVAGVPCNGAYVLEVEALLNDPEARPHVLSQPMAVGILPPPVTDLVVALDEPARRTTVTFTPLAPEQLARDALGYVLERGGPATSDGPGDFVDVGTIDLDAEPRFVDDLATAAGGTYTYRVRAMRAGAGEPERSSTIETPSDSVTIGDPPDAPGDEVAARPKARVRRSAGTAARRGSPSRRAATVTTVDTGFDDALDYGELPDGELPEGVEPGDVPLAGQSIITEEGEGGVDLAGPVAGALVLLGWAGHIAYLNRLARQL